VVDELEHCDGQFVPESAWRRAYFLA
jgi:hypothetical protein